VVHPRGGRRRPFGGSSSRGRPVSRRSSTSRRPPATPASRRSSASRRSVLPAPLLHEHTNPEAGSGLSAAVGRIWRQAHQASHTV